MFASVRRIALRAPVAAAAAAAIGTLAQPAAAPAQCSWLFGKSKEVQQLEEERARFEEEKRQLQAEKEAALAEKESALKKVAVKGQMTEMAKDVGSTVAVVGSTGIPQSLSYGFVAGYCSGYAAKKAGKLIALAAGGVYAGLQLLAFNGFIKINHDAIEDEFISYADLNNDGSVDGKDLAIAQQRGMEILKFGVPSIGGFGTGFALGLKHS